MMSAPNIPAFGVITGQEFHRAEPATFVLPVPEFSAPHYGLRYGCAPATGNFQRLRGRPPLVSPLKSCIGRSFTAVTRVQIPSGTPSLSHPYNLGTMWGR